MEFRILGPLEVIVEGDSPIRLGGAKQRALLAILLIHANEVVTADKLIDDIWGEAAPATAQNALQVYVSQLRKVLRPTWDGELRELILTRPTGYVLEASGDEIDLARFDGLSKRGREALIADDPAQASVLLRSALALWRGPTLADFMYEPFAQPHIERLVELRLLALEDRIEADLSLGRHAEIITEAQAVISTEPHRERLREHLMIALYRSGQQTEALNVYEAARQVLADQLGIDPSPPLQRMHEAILRQDPSLDLKPMAPPVMPPEVDFDEGPAREGPEPTTQPEARGEHVLPVTVLLAHIVESMSIADRLTDGEARAVIGECHSRMSRAVEDLGGTIQADVDDGICAYFGMPTTHEDDVDRAVRAGLRIRRVVSELAAELGAAWGITGFSVRIGINTGRVVVAPAGAAPLQELALGDSMVVASGLESSAEPGSIVISNDVAKRIEQRFALKQLADLKVKGRDGAVEAWELLGAIAPHSSPEGTPLVGRTRELDRGRGAIDELEAGRGQVMVIVGDAGIGKSRMVAELRAIADPQITWLTGSCRAYGGELSARPFVEILQDWLGVTEDDPPMLVRLRLRSQTDEMLGSDADVVRTSLAKFLAIEGEHTSNPVAAGADADADAQGLIRQAITALVGALATRNPAVVVLEDLHDAGPDALAVLDALVAITEEAPLLIILTARPERSEGWRYVQRVLADYRHRVTELQLESLDDEQAAFLVDALSPTGTLDAETTADLVARAAGNPLYIEELVRLMTDSGGFERANGWTLTASSSVVLIPPALEGMLVSRIQHLAPVVQGLAQAAAVIGQEVPARLLEDVAGAVDVHAGIGSLLHAEILRERRRYPELEYAFKHPLLREATLSTLTPGRVKELNGRVGLALETRDPEPTGDRLERIAFHFYRSDEQAKALQLLERAGSLAMEEGALGRAGQLLRRAKKVASTLEDTEAEGRIDRLLAGVPQEPDDRFPGYVVPESL